VPAGDRAAHAFDYAVVRVVPQVPREEFVNVGVVLFCDTLDFLGARIELDEARLRALCPTVDADLIALAREHLGAIPRICAGGEDAGPIGLLPPRERWHWIVSPRSTLLQTSRPHAGLCATPEKALDELVARLVRCPVP
jgi:hypothetical protein